MEENDQLLPPHLRGRGLQYVKIWISWDLGVFAVDPNHTIRQLKERIHQTEEFPMEWMKIYADGVECWDDEKTLRECEISGCTEVRVELLRSPRPLKVVVEYGGEWRWVEVDELDRIWTLRCDLERIGIDILGPHVCILNERIMKEDRTFKWHRVHQGDVITVIAGDNN